jgi:hypothetical protein
MTSPFLKERYMFGLAAALVEANSAGEKSWIAWTWVGGSSRPGDTGEGGAPSDEDDA